MNRTLTFAIARPYLPRMEITRTHTIKLDLPVEVAEATVSAWAAACNYASRVAFENADERGPVRNAVKLHRLCYHEVKAFGLSAQVAQSAIRHVASKYAALYTVKRKAKRPCWFRPNSAVALQGGERGRDFGFRGKGLSIWTVEGRIKGVGFHGGPMLGDYLADWRLGDGRMFVRKGEVYLSVSFSREVEPATKPNDGVIGVDRGINYLATATDGDKALFFGGGHTKHVRAKYQRTRASLQRKKALTNTRSIRRVLKRQSGKQARFMRDVNHTISRRIVDFARSTGNPTIAVEDLTGIRDRRLRKPQRKELNQWAFYQLEQFIRYKSEALGFDVIAVDPKNTSRGCSRCGYTAKSNRKRHEFDCGACGYRVHSDLNAASNIRLRGIVARQGLGGDASSSTGAEARGSEQATVQGLTGKPPSSGGGS